MVQRLCKGFVWDKLVAILLILKSATRVNGAGQTCSNILAHLIFCQKCKWCNVFFRLTFSRATLTIPLQQTNLIILIKAHSPFLNNLPIHLFAWVKNHIFSGTFPQLFLHFQQLQSPFPIANLSNFQSLGRNTHLFIYL